MDQRQMKVIDVDYSVKVGYLASKNNMREYKVYATLTWIFDLNFVEQLVTSSWQQCVASQTNKP
jgi:hypothetical protein